MAATPFYSSTLTVRDNTVKNVIFKAAAILIQFFLARIFAFVAFKLQDYTSYVMFSETLLQNIYFAVSRRFNTQAWIVLSFAVLAVASGFYDTLLWALDSPGYITKHSPTPASSLTLNLLQNPAYITFIGNPSHQVNDIDVEQAISANLFKTGFNFSLDRIPNLGPKEIVPPPNNSTSEPIRIWLDKDGFSVALDELYTVTMVSVCLPRAFDDSTQVWNCKLNSTESTSMINNRLGDVRISWYGKNTDLLSADRRDNPWQSLATGGDTTVMKQVFTVTKGRRRHTFLETVFKATMVTRSPPFDEDDVTDLIRRTWSDPSQPMDNATRALVDMTLNAQRNRTSFISGINTKRPQTVLSSSIELLDSKPVDKLLFTLLRINSVNITLIQSEDLSVAPEPFEPCDVSSTNIATGGRVQHSTCYKSVDNTRDNAFMGQIDTSSVVIFSNVVGDGASSKASISFNQTGYEWLKSQEGRVDDLLIARGVLLGGNKDIVSVTVLHNVAAISYLQLLLTVLPLVLAILAFALTELSQMSFYLNSFFAAIVTTTRPSSSRRPTRVSKLSTLRHPPEMILASQEDGHPVIETSDGGVYVRRGSPPSLPSIASERPIKSETQILMEPPFLQPYVSYS